MLMDIPRRGAQCVSSCPWRRLLLLLPLFCLEARPRLPMGVSAGMRLPAALSDARLKLQTWRCIDDLAAG
jgi:hypothetical protein